MKDQAHSERTTDWETVPLADAAIVGAGNSAPQKKELFESGLYPFIRTSDVGQIGLGEIGGARDLLNDAGVAKLRRVPKGAILMPKSGASTFLNHRVETTVDAYISSHLATIEARKDKALPRYLLYYLSTVKAQDLIQDHKYPSLTLGQIGKIPVPLPPLEEQKRIVARLDQAFAALDRARAHAEANLADAAELLENGVNDVFTELVASARVLPLSDAVHSDCKLSYGIVQPGDEVTGGLPVVRPVDLKSRHISRKGMKTISPDRAEGYARTKLVGGEILLCVRGSTGEMSVADPDLVGANVTRGIVPIRFPAETVLPEFAYFQLRSRYTQDQIAAGTNGAALMQINIKDLRNLRFILPEIERQRETLRRVEALYDNCGRMESSYSARLTDIADLRQSLLQKAFSGQLT